MRLKPYLTEHKVSPADFAAKIGVTYTAVSRYVSGARIPHRSVMARIERETKGAVTPNDFFLAKQEAAA